MSMEVFPPISERLTKSMKSTESARFQRQEASATSFGQTLKKSKGGRRVAAG